MVGADGDVVSMVRKKAGVCKPGYKLFEQGRGTHRIWFYCWALEGRSWAAKAASMLNISTGPGIASLKSRRLASGICFLGINPSVNADIGHDVMCTETINGMIILRDDVVEVDAVEVDEVTEE